MQRTFSWVILVLLVLGIKIFSLFPDAVEQYYSQGAYPYIALFQRTLFGWIPFSVGDIIYLLLGLALCRILYRFLLQWVRKKLAAGWWKTALKSLLFWSLLLYVCFNLFWGLNYNRKGIAFQMGIETDSVSKEALTEVMQQLVVKVNALDSTGRKYRQELARKKKLFGGAASAYDALQAQRPWIGYPVSSQKPSLFSYLGNYLGYTGYYNPLTGEAQVNTTVPLFIQPFTACHEIGHQLGYAKENEANFAGFLSARVSRDPAFQYAVYFELYSYGRPFLYLADSLQLRRCDSLLQPGVKKDFRDLRAFYKRHENPIEEVIDKLYGRYLMANEQPDGKMTYSKVIVWLVAYYRKYGEL